MRSFASVDLSQAQVLDGGFATELERRGVETRGPLWSARALEEAPSAVIAVHRSYLDVGVDVLLTGSYQVSILGFLADGLSAEAAAAAAERALRRSVALALEARAQAGRPAVLVAASLGPYGAALANGAEYHGRYGFADEEAQHQTLLRFHAERIAVLAETEADLLAFETVPSLAEARAIAAALAAQATADCRPAAWITFTCRDGKHTSHGESLRECAAFVEAVPQFIALGVNCTAPAFISELLGELRAGSTKPLVVYPNSGEGWDAMKRAWTGAEQTSSTAERTLGGAEQFLSGGSEAAAYPTACPAACTEASPAAFAVFAAQWYTQGAQLVGGCCRTGPAHIASVAAACGRRTAC